MNKFKFTLSKTISSGYKGFRRNQIYPNDQRILMYHSIGDVEQDLFKDIYKIDKDIFKSHMKVVKNNFDKRVKDLEKIKLSETNLEPILNITFDDGYDDTISKISGICEEKQWPITFYPLINFVDNKPMIGFIISNIIKYSKLLKLNELTFDVINSHKMLTQYLYNKMYTFKVQDYDQIIKEIIAAIEPPIN